MTLILFRVLVGQHAQFRKQCNAFFIDLVSTMCFKDNSPPSSDVILILLSFLMVEANTVPNVKGARANLPYFQLYMLTSLPVFTCIRITISEYDCIELFPHPSTLYRKAGEEN